MRSINRAVAGARLCRVLELADPLAVDDAIDDAVEVCDDKLLPRAGAVEVGVRWALDVDELLGALLGEAEAEADEETKDGAEADAVGDKELADVDDDEDDWIADDSGEELVVL